MPAGWSSAIYVAGYKIPNDGGGGWFLFSLDDEIEDGGTVFKGAHGGVWIRIFDGNLNPRWYGAAGNGTSDDSSAFQKAIDACAKLKKAISIDSGHYRLEHNIVKDSSFQCPSMYGGAQGSTLLDFSALPAGKSGITLRGGSGGLCGAVLRDLAFRGSGVQCGLSIEGMGGISIENCSFTDLAIGVMFHNRNKGDFTECCVASKCKFDKTCAIAGEYRVSNGDRSFHGSGFHQCFINTATTAILINQGAFVYNAELSVFAWIHGAATLVDNRSKFAASFFGVVNLETLSGFAKLANGSNVYLAGNILASNERFEFGTLIQARTIVFNSDGSTSLLESDRQIKVKLRDRYTALFSIEESWFAQIVVEGQGYDARNFLLIVHNGFGAIGQITGIGRPMLTDAIGLGGPTFEISKEGAVFISLDRKPKDPLDACISLRQIGQRQPANHFVS